jgi:NAD(P)H-dependent FMN reductase
MVIPIMTHIAIISGSIREGRNSHRVALYFQNYIREQLPVTSEVLDLKAYNFPLFEERLRFQKEVSAEVASFADIFKKADGIILVTPEYNGGYPASVKNVIDLFDVDWYKKPIAIATVSSGDFGGSQVITSLQFSLWKIKAWVVSPAFPVPRAEENFDVSGNPKDKPGTDHRAAAVLKELLWYIEARKKMGI